MPSFSIYATELIQEYGCRTLIRVGSCGGLQDDVKVRDLILALAASTDSAMNRPFFGDATFAPTADFGLLLRAREEAARQDLPIHVGTVLTTDTFYTPLPEPHEVWRRHRILAVEMETAALYSLAARHGCRALSILTVSDHVRSGATLPAEERERSLVQMMKLALDVATPDPLSVRRP
jgi:purine-nucleoside phosphorylase